MGSDQINRLHRNKGEWVTHGRGPDVGFRVGWHIGVPWQAQGYLTDWLDVLRLGPFYPCCSSKPSHLTFPFATSFCLYVHCFFPGKGSGSILPRKVHRRAAPFRQYWGLLQKNFRFETYPPVGTFPRGWYVLQEGKRTHCPCWKSAAHISTIQMTGRLCSICWWVPKCG